jgi:hypothetical protein
MNPFTVVALCLIAVIIAATTPLLLHRRKRYALEKRIRETARLEGVSLETAARLVAIRDARDIGFYDGWEESPALRAARRRFRATGIMNAPYRGGVGGNRDPYADIDLRADMAAFKNLLDPPGTNG